MLNKNRTVAKELTTSTADVYAVPAAFKANVSSIVIANSTDTHVNTTVSWRDAVTATSYVLFGGISMKPHSTVQITQPLFLDKNDKITAVASVGSAVTVSVRVEEYFAERL